MSNMIIKVKFFTGTEFEEAVKEAKEKAQLFNVSYIAFMFNGINCSIGPNADIETAKKDYAELINKESILGQDKYIVVP